MKEHRPHRRGAWSATAFAMGLVLAGLACLCAVPAGAVEDPWAPGTSWLSVRAGYAKMAADQAPNGAAGYGIGYTRMLGPLWVFKHYSLGANVHHELLGRVGPAAVVDVPFSLELDHHFLWNGGLRPYMGVGWSANYLKGYRFPDTPGDVRGGAYLVGGTNTVVNANSLIGFDARVGTLSNIERTYVWSIKLNYSWVY